MELFKQMTGADILHVPYRGGAPALMDLLGGRVQLMFDNLPTLLGSVRDGRVRALAVTGTERSVPLPDVPTLADFLPGCAKARLKSLAVRVEGEAMRDHGTAPYADYGRVLPSFSPR
jgi:hypothetical protein